MLSEIKRETLIAAVEAGIAADAAVNTDFSNKPSLDKTAVAKLREYAQTTRHAVYGTFWDEIVKCGCPLTDAGLVTNQENGEYCGLRLTSFGLEHIANEGPRNFHTDFWRGYDLALDDEKYYRYLTVVN